MTKGQNEGITGQTKPKQIFISYSHDSDQHKARVKDLADQLTHAGISRIFDQDIENDCPEEGWPSWAEKSILDVDYVIIVCTEGYYRRIRGEIEEDVGRGVKWEYELILNLLYSYRYPKRSIIPVLLSRSDETYIPERLIGQAYYCLDSESGYKKMFDRISGQIKKNGIEKEVQIEPDGELHPKIQKIQNEKKSEEPEKKKYPKRKSKYKYLVYISVIIVAVIAAFIFLKSAVPNWKYKNLLRVAGEYIKNGDYPKADEYLDKAKKNRGRVTDEIAILIKEKQIVEMKGDFDSLKKFLAGGGTEKEKLGKCREFLSKHQNTTGNKDTQAMRDETDRFISELNTDIKVGEHYQKFINDVNNLIKNGDYEKAKKVLDKTRVIKDSDDVKRLYVTITQGLEKERTNGEKEFKSIKDKLTLSQYQAFKIKYPQSVHLLDLRDILNTADRNLPPEKYWDESISKNEKGYFEYTFVKEHNGHLMIYIPENKFWIDKYEVSWAQFRKFINKAKIQFSPITDDTIIRGGDDYPAVVTYDGAQKYCQCYGLKLPSAEQWEYAAGKEKYLYPWGNESPDGNGTYRANYNSSIGGVEGDGFVGTAPVESYEKFSSPFGIVNMSGNVWEWVQGGTLKGGGFLSSKEDLKIKSSKTGNSGKEGFRCIKKQK